MPAPKKKATTTRKATASKQPLHKHVITSLTSVAPHAHTGKKAAHRHTSHGFLLLALILTGALLFGNLGALQAYGVTQAGSVNVSVNVYGTPPTQGAEIGFPVTNSRTTLKQLEVRGSCPDQTLVSLYRNGVFSGSAVCSSSAFSIVTDLSPGVNVLETVNYDGMNQAGPSTPQVVVEYDVPVETPATTNNPVVATVETQLTELDTPIVAPETPKPAENPCFTASNALATTSSLSIKVGCIYRNIFAGETLSLPLAIEGGIAPFALSANWGDTNEDLVTILDNKKRTLQHTYAVGGFYQIHLKATDSVGSSAQVQTVVSVNGDSTIEPISNIDKVIKAAESVWVDAPVPLYFAAVALAVGFWIGDIFQRVALAKNSRTTHKRTRKA